MKKLTKVKLINWHYLTNTTVDIYENCLITGDNGSGKSTILDAMQYVLTGGKAKFNSAAHERAKNAAKEAINHRLGSIGYRFFDLLTKALAFKAIENVKDFVYSYILDEKEVNIDYLKENVRTYMDFEKTLELIKTKLGRLEEIQKQYQLLNKNDEELQRQKCFTSLISN